MTQTPQETINVPDAGIGEFYFSHTAPSLFLPFSTAAIAPLGSHPYPPQSAPAQAPEGSSHFFDGSGPIFSMYLEMAAEEDKKMTENWKADADGVLIFVRFLSSNLVLHTESILTDRFILSCCRIIDLSVYSRYSTEPTRHFQLLSREHISDSCRPKSTEHFEFPP